MLSWRLCDMAFTGEERAFCTLQFEATRSQAITQRKFTSKYKKKSPSIPTIKKWHANFLKTGSSTTPRKAPPPTVLTPVAVERISDYFEVNEYCSIRRASLALEMKKSSVQKVLKLNDWYPYKIQIVQKLNENDRILRKAFAEVEWSDSIAQLDPLWLLLVGIYQVKSLQWAVGNKRRGKRKDKKGIPGAHHGANLQTGYDGVPAAPAEMPQKPRRASWDCRLDINFARIFLLLPQKLEVFLKKMVQTRSLYLNSFRFYSVLLPETRSVDTLYIILCGSNFIINFSLHHFWHNISRIITLLISQFKMRNYS